ncbi:MAG: hypothetical protein KDA93_00510 [Planctomycetaceae bacterium]|nr:hypothetical protein [Planctomycetaceae bacterium]
MPRSSWGQEAGSAADYDRLLDPAIASSLQLTAEQTAQLTEIISQRDAAVTEAPDDQKASLTNDAATKLADVLTDEQSSLFDSLYRKKLQFNFQYAKWADVLIWIADESGLSLVRDAPPAGQEAPPTGTFNYTDTKEYSPIEAIDLLNGWLQTKGFALLRRDRLLMLIDLSNGLPKGVVPRVSIEELPLRGRFELVSVMLPLENRPAEAVMTEIEPLLGSYGTAESLPANKQLLLTDTAGNLMAIHKIALGVPPPPGPKPAPPEPPKPVMEVVPFVHANPGKLEEVLKQFVSGTVMVDGEAKQITLNAVPDQIANAKAILARLEENQGPANQPRLSVYPAPQRNTNEVLNTLQLVAPGSRIRIDDQSQQLQVFATPEEQAIIVATLEKLGSDATPDSDDRQLQIYPITGMAPEAAAEALRNVMPRLQLTVDSQGKRLIVFGSMTEHRAVASLVEQVARQPEGPSVPTLKAYPIDRSVDTSLVTSVITAAVPQAVVTSDTAQSRLLVVAPAVEQDRIAKLVEETGQGNPAGKKSLVTYPVDRTADTSLISSLLTSLVPTATVNIDSNQHRLLIMASAADHERVTEIVQQIGQGSPESTRKLIAYPIDRALSLDTVSSLLTNVVPQAQVTQDVTNQRLVVIASEADHAQVTSTIEQMSRDAGVSLPALKFYTLEKVDGSLATSILQSLVPTASLSFDQTSKRLTATASPRDHEVITETLAKLEEVSTDREEASLKVYDVTPTQKSRFTSLSASLAPQLPHMQNVSGNEPGELALWATPSEHAVIEQILAQLKREIPADLKSKLVVYPLLKVDAASTAEVLRPLFPDATITPDPKVNRLQIFAKPAQQETLKQAIEQLDTDVPEATEIKLLSYPVKGMDANIATQLITQQFPNVTVLSDTTAQSLIVRALPREHEQVSSLLDDLRASSSAMKEHRVVIYPAVSGDSGSIYNFFASAFPTARVLVDPSTNRMTVWASTDEHDQIRSAVDEMVNDDTQNVSLKSYNLKDVAYSTMSTLMSQLLKSPRFAVSPDGRRMVVWASDTEHELVSKLVTDLNSDDARPDVTLKTYDIEGVPQSTISSIIGQVLTTPKYAYSPDGKRLVLWAEDEEHELVDSIVRNLTDDDFRAEHGQVSVFNVQPLSTAAARALLAPIVPTVTFTDTPDGTALLAWVDEADRTRIRETLDQVMSDKGLAGQREMRIYDISKVGGAKAQQVLATVVPGAPMTLPDGGRTLIVMAREDEHQRITAALDQLADEGPFREDRTMELYSIRDLGPNINSVISTLVPHASINAGPVGDQLAIIATTEEHTKVKSLIDRLSNAKQFRAINTVTYELGKANPDAVRQALAPFMNSDVQISVDPNTRRIYVRTFADRQDRLAGVIKEMTRPPADDQELVTRSYRTNTGDAAQAVQVLQALMPTATFVRDNDARIVTATATIDQHETIASVVEDMRAKGQRGDELQPMTYPLKQADPDATLQTLNQLYSRTPDVAFTLDRASRTIVAIAMPEQHEKIGSLITKLDSESDDSPGRLQTRTYRMGRGEADEAQEVLRALMPSATIVTDDNRRVIAATATATEHEVIASVIDELRSHPGGEDGLQPVTYRLKVADPRDVMWALQDLFKGARDVSLSVDRGTRTLVAIALPEQQETIRTLIEQIDSTNLDDHGRTTQVYKLRQTDNNTAVQMVNDVLALIDPDASVTFNDRTRQLVVTTNQQGHAQVSELSAQLGQRDERTLEVFQLEYLEPFDAMIAVDTLYSDDGIDPEDQPSTQTNDDAQQLIVRATPEQIIEIRSLLTKMGETSLSTEGGPSRRRNLRVIPLDGNIDQAVQKIEKLWPQIRRNPIRILTPGSMQPLPQRDAPPQPNDQLPPGDDNAQSSPSRIDAYPSELIDGTLPVAFYQDDNATPPPANETDAPPVVIIPGQDRITIASEDIEALNQLEDLLKSVLSPGRRLRGRDFTVYALENAGAAEVAATLMEFFSGRNRVASGTVQVVPDERLNALVVYAGRTEREHIENLLEVLDSPNVPQNLKSFETRVVRIEYADASRIRNTLQEIYRVQLRGGGRPPTIPIPEGVSLEVVTSLNLINAAAAAPLLTIEDDPTTNSLVMLGPTSLLDEVEALIHQLDESVAENPARGVSIIPLKKSRSTNVMQILQQLRRQ